MNPLSEFACGGIALRRVRRGAGYGHVLALSMATHGERSTLTLESIDAAEDAADEAAAADSAWPLSPPLVDWNCQRTPRGWTLLALGSAAAAHWSASIELTDEDTARFDVAARVIGAPGFLGSQYRVSPAAAREFDAPNIEVSTARSGCLALPGGWLVECDADTSVLRYDDAAQVVAIEPRSVAAAPRTTSGAQTFRWRYAIRRVIKNVPNPQSLESRVPQDQ